MSHIDLKTPNEKAIYKIFKKHHALNATDIIDLLPEIDRATVYRIIKRLIKRDVLKELNLNSTKSYFELTNQAHHHHIICSSCNRIIPIVISDKVEKNIQNLENNISNSLNFLINDHFLNFYGNCKDCS